MIGLDFLAVSLVIQQRITIMNQINPKKLSNSKWTKLAVHNKEKHFIVTVVKYDEDQSVTRCVIQAVITQNEYDINWRDLKDPQQWRLGWQ